MDQRKQWQAAERLQSYPGVREALEAIDALGDKLREVGNHEEVVILLVRGASLPFSNEYFLPSTSTSLVTTVMCIPPINE